MKNESYERVGKRGGMLEDARVPMKSKRATGVGGEGGGAVVACVCVLRAARDLPTHTASLVLHRACRTPLPAPPRPSLPPSHTHQQQAERRGRGRGRGRERESETLRPIDCERHPGGFSRGRTMDVGVSGRKTG